MVTLFSSARAKFFTFLMVFSSLLVSSVAIAQAGADFRGLFKPIEKPSANELEKPIVRLGEKLYSDPILSLDQSQSCNTCHNLSNHGVDNEPTSKGVKGERGDRNSPTVLNASLHIAQFWDGRAKDVEEQALGPILNPVEMAVPSEGEVVKRLSGHKEYPKLFKAAFPDDKSPISFKHVGDAIGAFERTLLTPSRFDQYLKGDDQALSQAEKNGLKEFVGAGCAGCHNGAAVGGGMYQKLGLVVPYETEDLGRYNVTKSESDRYVFKVPSLRNVTHTEPYFHDGSISTLGEAVKKMGKHQLGKELKSEQIESIITFLGSL